MENYKKDFISFMIESGVLLFGDFITKSGRKTPYFINTGNYNTGNQMKKLGKFYAAAINENIIIDSCDVSTTGRDGIFLYTSDYSTIKNNEFNDIAIAVRIGYSAFSNISIVRSKITMILE